MIITPLEFTASFMFLCSLLLMGVIYGRSHWLLKAILVVSSLGFSIVCYKGYQNILGYPVSIKTPETFQFLFGVVKEPYPAKNEHGAIYIWIIMPLNSEPRAIQLPYSKPNREAVQAAKEKVKKGERVFMTKKSVEGEEDKDGKGIGRKNSGKPGTQNGAGGGNTVPYELDNDILDFVQPELTIPNKNSE
jgi:hypothetical protein